MQMEDLLQADFGEKSSRIVVSFKKTIQLEQFNPETVQVDAEAQFEGHMSAIERDTIVCVLQDTVEYQVISHLYKKGLIDKGQFFSGKEKLEQSAESMLIKYEKVTGKNRAEILNRTT